jgi:hypothetical protein
VQLVWKTSLQDIVESPTLLKSISVLTTEGANGEVSTHITLLVDGKIYFLRPEFLVRGTGYVSYQKLVCSLWIFLTVVYSFENMIRPTEMWGCPLGRSRTRWSTTGLLGQPMTQTTILFGHSMAPPSRYRALWVWWKESFRYPSHY